VSEVPYRAPQPVPPDPYVVAWAEQRRRSNRVVLTVVATSTASVSMVISMHMSGPRWVYPGILAECVGLVFMAVATWRAAAFRCPHCQMRFRQLPVARTDGRCARCGIKLGTPKSAVLEAEKRRTAGVEAEGAEAAGARIAEADAEDTDVDIADAANDGSRAGGA
jgi:hypothetical protein